MLLLCIIDESKKRIAKILHMLKSRVTPSQMLYDSCSCDPDVTAVSAGRSGYVFGVSQTCVPHGENGSG